MGHPVYGLSMFDVIILLLSLQPQLRIQFHN